MANNRLTIRIPESVHVTLTDFSKTTGVPINHVVCEALEAFTETLTARTTALAAIARGNK